MKVLSQGKSSSSNYYTNPRSQTLIIRPTGIRIQDEETIERELEFSSLTPINHLHLLASLQQDTATSLIIKCESGVKKVGSRLLDSVSWLHLFIGASSSKQRSIFFTISVVLYTMYIPL